MVNSPKLKILCVFGPTSTGKTELAVHVAKKFSGEIVSADSMQIYRGFDIGTGKVNEEEKQGVVHHLLDCCDPDENFSAGRFQREADLLIEQIKSRGNLPIFAGGTGLYFKALLSGMAHVGSSDHAIRSYLEKRVETKGIYSHYNILRRLDPVTAERLSENDTQRIQRALEYRLKTGLRLSDAIANKPFQDEERYQTLKIGLKIDRSILKKRIDARIERMFKQGWVTEVSALLESGLHRESQSLRAIGYREIVKLLDKEVTLEEAKELIKVATHQYAKRQETWFKKVQGVNWISVSSSEKMKCDAVNLVISSNFLK